MADNTEGKMHLAIHFIPTNGLNTVEKLNGCVNLGISQFSFSHVCQQDELFHQPPRPELTGVGTSSNFINNASKFKNPPPLFAFIFY